MAAVARHLVNNNTLAALRCTAQIVLHEVSRRARAVPARASERDQCFNLFQDAGGSMRLFMWHKEQKAVSHCLTAILQMVQT